MPHREQTKSLALELTMDINDSEGAECYSFTRLQLASHKLYNLIYLFVTLQKIFLQTHQRVGENICTYEYT